MCCAVCICFRAWFQLQCGFIMNSIISCDTMTATFITIFLVIPLKSTQSELKPWYTCIVENHLQSAMFIWDGILTAPLLSLNNNKMLVSLRNSSIQTRKFGYSSDLFGLMTQRLSDYLLFLIVHPDRFSWNAESYYSNWILFEKCSNVYEGDRRI